MDISTLTIDAVREGLAGAPLSAAELAAEALRFAEAENPKTNAYLHFCPERALAAARARGRAHRARRRSRAAGRRAGRGERRHRHPRRAHHLRLAAAGATTFRLTTPRRWSGWRQAGGVILGKTNCDEFAMGSSTENSAFGPVRNPVALDRVPGGSSGGSAAAVAQGTAVVALGSDTGGSVRQPASFCGVVGVTPTYGRVSRYGLTAFASSLDHIGPFARTVKDAATLLQVIAGRDPWDSTSAGPPCRITPPRSTGNVKGLKLGLPREYLKDLTSESGDLIQSGVEALRRLGCEVREISLPAHRVRHRLLLHHRHRRSQLQPGAV